MVQLREKRLLNQPPPVYKNENEYLTLVLHYGGKMESEPFCQYIGGDRLVIDYVVVPKVTLIYLKNLLNDWLFMNGDVRLFVLNENTFKCVSSDDEVKGLCLNSMVKREVVFFVQERGVDEDNMVVTENFSESDNLDKFIDEFGDSMRNEGEVVNLGSVFLSAGEGSRVYTNRGRFVRNAMDDFEWSDENEDDSDYNLEEENEDDDALFSKYVSVDVNEGDVDEDSDEEVDVVNVTQLPHHIDSEAEDDEPTYVVFNPATIFEPHFELGMIVSSRDEFMFVVQSHAITEKRTVVFSKIAPLRVYAKCENIACNWKIHLTKHSDEETFQITQFFGKHDCPEQYHVKNLKSTWLSKRYMHTIVADRNRKVTNLRLDMMADLKFYISNEQVYRAKDLAIKKLEGDAELQYAKVWDYAQEVRRSNPGSTVIVGAGNVEIDTERFERIYICFDAVKKGFKGSCRPFIGIDGCHLKGKYKGILLTAVGVDANNGIYPIAWAVVNRESRESCEWFLVILKQDLDIVDGEYTFMSDKQKGLIQAMTGIFPNSEHRFCVRHLTGNMSLAGFKGETFRQAVWRASQATTDGEWKQKMLVLKRINEDAWKWLDAKQPHQWTKSHFSENCKCDTVLNNACEVFNATILDAREMPILTMLEWIRQWVMARFQRHRDFSTPRWKGKVCPRIKKIVEKNAGMVSNCIPIKGNNIHYEIRCSDGGQFIVNLQERSCSCRSWGLSGIPCNHAISAINHQKLDKEDFVDKCYTVKTFKNTYAGTIMGVNGPQMWADSMIIPPLPPHMAKGKGKQSTSRKKGVDEKAEAQSKKRNNTKLKRRQKTITCSKCGVEGHNVVTCGKEKVNKVKKRKVPNVSSNNGASSTVSEVYEEDESHASGISTQHSQARVLGPSMMQQLHGDRLNKKGSKE